MSQVVPSDGAVASPHVLATRAGEQALADGGSAVDAAIAAAAVLAVVTPDMCGLGGDAVALVATEGTGVTRFQGAGRAAAAVDVDAVRRSGRGRMPLFGVHTVTVPGALSTWEAIHRQSGRLAWARVLEPAVAVAEQGFTVGAGLEESVRGVLPRADPGLLELLVPGGTPLAAGDRLVQPALARTLTAIADEGAAAVYGGSVGERLVRYLRDCGSPLDLADLARHRCDVGAPLTSRWGGARLWTAPPPSQGVTLLQILALLTALSAASDRPRDFVGRDAGLQARAFGLATTVREQALADCGEGPVDTEPWLGDRELRSAVERLLGDEPPASAPTPARRPDGDTVGVVAADRDGGYVSMLFSLFYGFGSGLRDPATGLVLHNRGAGFSVDPDSPNLLAAGRRPAHSLMPLLVGDDSGVTAAHGTMGGYGQPQIHAQLLLRLAAGEDPTDVVAAPRWVVGRSDDGGRLELLVESSVPDGVQAALREAGLPVVMLGPLDHQVGHAQLVRRQTDGTLVAATDPRADGAEPAP